MTTGNAPTIEEQIKYQELVIRLENKRGHDTENEQAILASLEKLAALESQQKLGKCKICNGNDADIPCAYTTEKPDGCLRAARLEKPVPVEPKIIGRLRDAILDGEIAPLQRVMLQYIDSLTSALQRAQEERDTAKKNYQFMVGFLP